MAYLQRQRYQKNATGEYDIIHYETDSLMILRPNGHTVEEDLANYLPTTQADDNQPVIANQGKLVTGYSKVYAKLGNGTVTDLTEAVVPDLSTYAKKTDIPARYVHPSTKVCSYAGMQYVSLATYASNSKSLFITNAQSYARIVVTYICTTNTLYDVTLTSYNSSSQSQVIPYSYYNYSGSSMIGVYRIDSNKSIPMSIVYGTFEIINLDGVTHFCLPNTTTATANGNYKVYTDAYSDPAYSIGFGLSSSTSYSGRFIAHGYKR